MNALNILSGISSTPPPSPPRSRTSSTSNINDARRSSRAGDATGMDAVEDDSFSLDADAMVDEKSPLVHHHDRESATSHRSLSARFWRIPKRLVNGVVATIKVVLATIAAPGRYVVACFYDDQGKLSAMVPIRKIFRSRRRKSYAQSSGLNRDAEEKDGYHEKPRLRPKSERGEISASDGFAQHSQPVEVIPTTQPESDSEKLSSIDAEDSPARNTRSKTASKDETTPARKSIRIKLHSDEGLQQRKRQRSPTVTSTDTQEDKVAAVANSLKSPSSPASATKLKYPRAPAAPRPLIPKRQPSYIFTHNTETPKKTLIIDLDETLIHSMAKGGRMSTGHMVEVKLGPISGGGVALGPQVPILYYVHERPYCHEFLRKVRQIISTPMATSMRKDSLADSHVTGVQVVQPHRVYRVSSGVC